MKRKEVERRLSRAGWNFVRHGGRHDIWSDGKREITLPRHNDLNEYTADSIIREAEGK